MYYWKTEINKTKMKIMIMILPYFDYSDVIYSNSNIPEIKKNGQTAFQRSQNMLKNAR